MDKKDKKKKKKGFGKLVTDAGQEFVEEVVRGMSSPKWRPRP